MPPQPCVCSIASGASTIPLLRWRILPSRWAPTFRPAIIAENELQGYAALLINPLVAVSTGDIFAAWDGIDRGPLGEGTVMAVARSGRNDLQKPAVALVPILTDMLQMLDGSEPIMAQMSGSGATCFALYDTLAAAAEAERHCRQATDNIRTMKGEFR